MTLPEKHKAAFLAAKAFINYVSDPMESGAMGPLYEGYSNALDALEQPSETNVRVSNLPLSEELTRLAKEYPGAKVAVYSVEPFIHRMQIGAEMQLFFFEPKEELVGIEPDFIVMPTTACHGDMYPHAMSQLGRTLSGLAELILYIPEA